MPRVSAPRDTLEKLLAECLDSAHPADADVSRRHQVVPLMGDFMGWWVLTMSGDVAFVPHDEPTKLELVGDHPVHAIGIHVALAQGSRRYPALASIRPVRAADAIPCKSCDGTGRIPGMPENITCACGGMGWLPPQTLGAA